MKVMIFKYIYEIMQKTIKNIFFYSIGNARLSAISERDYEDDEVVY